MKYFYFVPCLKQILVSESPQTTEYTFKASPGSRPPRGALQMTSTKSEGRFLLSQKNRVRGMCLCSWYQFRSGCNSALKLTKTNTSFWQNMRPGRCGPYAKPIFLLDLHTRCLKKMLHTKIILWGAYNPPPQKN